MSVAYKATRTKYMLLRHRNMDDLCNSFRKQSLICPDENNVKLKQGFHLTRHMLKKATDTIFSQSELESYLRDLSQRYTEYLHKIPFRGTFGYLRTMLQGALVKIETLRGESLVDRLQDVVQIMLIGFFIDCDLLFAIGACEIDDD